MIFAIAMPMAVPPSLNLKPFSWSKLMAIHLYPVFILSFELVIIFESRSEVETLTCPASR
jgi:hypothetical protein